MIAINLEMFRLSFRFLGGRYIYKEIFIDSDKLIHFWHLKPNLNLENFIYGTVHQHFEVLLFYTGLTKSVP